MRRRRWSRLLVLAAMFVSGVASAGLIGGLLKAGATKLLIEKHGDGINDFMNTLSRNQDLGRGYATKVVYVISLGDGLRAGAVQVIGPPKQVAKVRAVVQVEGRFKLLDMRVRGLVPIDNDKGTFRGPERVEGVGVCGQIDLDL